MLKISPPDWQGQVLTQSLVTRPQRLFRGQFVRATVRRRFLLRGPQRHLSSASDDRTRYPPRREQRQPPQGPPARAAQVGPSLARAGALVPLRVVSASLATWPTDFRSHASSRSFFRWLSISRLLPDIVDARIGRQSRWRREHKAEPATRVVCQAYGHTSAAATRTLPPPPIDSSRSRRGSSCG